MEKKLEKLRDMSDDEKMEELRKVMRELPDIERLRQNISELFNEYFKKNHNEY